MTDMMMISDGSDPGSPPEIRPATPEEQAQIDAQRAASAADQHSVAQVQAFALSEDTERLALVRERAETDPAFAALVDLTLGKQGV